MSTFSYYFFTLAVCSVFDIIDIDIAMLIAGIFYVKPNRFNLGESIEYTEITPVNYEKKTMGNDNIHLL